MIPGGVTDPRHLFLPRHIHFYHRRPNRETLKAPVKFRFRFRLRLHLPSPIQQLTTKEVSIRIFRNRINEINSSRKLLIRHFVVCHKLSSIGIVANHPRVTSVRTFLMAVSTFFASPGLSAIRLAAWASLVNRPDACAEASSARSPEPASDSASAPHSPSFPRLRQ